jgi:hypothetical protein
VRRASLALLLLVVGCSRAVTPPIKVTAKQDLGVLRTLAVMPAVPAPAMVGDASAPEVVTRLLYAAALREAAWSVVDAAKARAALAKIPAASPEARAGTVAARVGADGALTATISTFRERVGSAYGVSEPASVSLQLLLVRARQQDAAWKADYSITQEPLAYNLWNLWGVLRGGPKWLTAEELAKIGVDEAVARLAAAAGASR